MIQTLIDLGQSLTKVVFSDRGRLDYLLMSPEVTSPLTKEHLQLLQMHNATAAPENAAWLEVGDELRVVGSAAENFGGDTGADERKERRAVLKTLAVLGAIRERSQLPNQLTVQVALLLPMTEFTDALKVCTKIQEAATDFSFRGQPVNLSMPLCKPYPEGFGLFLGRRSELSLRNIAPDSRTFLVLMLGHRNASILVFQNGQPQPGKSTSNGPGFKEAIESSAAVQGILVRDYGKLLNAFVSKNPKVVFAGESQVRDVSEALRVGRATYWGQLESFLINNFVRHVDATCEVIIGGGASMLIESELIEFLNQLGIEEARRSFGEGVRRGIADRFGHDKFALENSLSIRMVDAFAAFQHFQRQQVPI
ncbi:hypothetical protein NIES2135_67220 (plasmid) [Leptolyngbya boryana NIES-2135]|jgi:hypothetical protein|uniref:Actin-like protein N-terminal domain-containing protein n=1 Tax=Leptolyngbya boryana NIES-2135 TaxID=1973484 RepID=A0A1Z4JSU3_LEPBY|nr:MULTISPECIES: ParM/StbA family protein [Leptolyngbya]BAY59845.1 hypothetical protein NIES2135_67220 [Leptolyngbya boryana NIES-2135]MBD2369604.1 ParM/StbA family protein [Leptolyngbya sp. FACHB-161]MBD2375951.1 ParM/StbA family protein [Leptolyngbya sp. FACHB-238]MBD2400227.1 ParM/StbA family protein [Leptolyngbya sp. FACHB-239]MBD2406768.1 ParM/StbA family protein [Leptolyngbya sp. FACHB-402]